MEDFNYETINSIWKKAHFKQIEKTKKQIQKKLEKAARQGKAIAVIPTRNKSEYAQISDWLQTLGFWISSTGWDNILKIHLDCKKGEEF
jgi:uncharacterized protein YgbK (DUF1537 family)